MKFNIDRIYKEKLSLYEKKFSKYENMITADAVEYSIEFKDKVFKIWWKTIGQTKSCEYAKNGVKQFNVFSQGCLIVFRDKKYIFIPVTENDNKNEFLIDFCTETRKEVGEHKVGAAQRLLLPDGEGGKYHVSFDGFDSPVFIVIVALLAAIMGFVFFIGGDDYKNVTRETCVEYTGVVSNITGEAWYEKNDYCDIEFVDGELYTVDGTVISDDVKNALKTIKAGDTVTLLYYEEEYSVMEVTSDGREILPFEWAYEVLNREATIFYWMGIGVWAVDIFLLGYGIRGIIREKKEKL